MHSTPEEGNFCDEHGKRLKLAIVKDYNRHMRCMEKSDCMTNSYCTSMWTWE